MKPGNLNYTDAVRRLDAILEDIDQSRVPVDVLAERVLEAASLLKHCKSILTETESQVKAVLDDLENAFGEKEDEEDEK